MKLIEKMAKGAALDEFTGFWPYVPERESDFSDGFEAGFRAAREMAVEEVKMDQAIIRAIQAWTEDENAMALFDNGTKSRIESMQNIGEAEVDS